MMRYWWRVWAIVTSVVGAGALAVVKGWLCSHRRRNGWSSPPWSCLCQASDRGQRSHCQNRAP